MDREQAPTGKVPKTSGSAEEKHRHKFTYNMGTMCICGKTRGIR